MLLTLKPKGRGNWKTSTLHIEGAHQLPCKTRTCSETPASPALYKVCATATGLRSTAQTSASCVLSHKCGAVRRQCGCVRLV